MSQIFEWDINMPAAPPVSNERPRKRARTTSSDTSTKRQKMPSNIQRLEDELAFTQDALATVIVMFDSLNHAYNHSKETMDRLSTPTRLCEMEKELLAAYDDLGLQVVHLEKDMNKLEKRLTQLREKQSKQQQQQEQQQQQPLQPAPVFSPTVSTVASSASPENSPIVPFPQTPDMQQQQQQFVKLENAFPVIDYYATTSNLCSCPGCLAPVSAAAPAYGYYYYPTMWF